MSTWADVVKGDELELNGRTWRVVKIKPRKKKADVVLDYRGRRAESTVKLADSVTIVRRDPLFDSSGTAQRWATDDEAASAGLTMPTGDPDATRPPAAPGDDVWETRRDKVERRLSDLLQARLVGESTDESSGYYVPPVNVSTVAAHLALFHGGIPDACSDDEGAMLAAHDAQHAAALKGEGILPVNHWHTAKRPALDK